MEALLNREGSFTVDLVLTSLDQQLFFTENSILAFLQKQANLMRSVD
jgi:hypothetical protein